MWKCVDCNNPFEQIILLRVPCEFLVTGKVAASQVTRQPRPPLPKHQLVSQRDITSYRAHVHKRYSSIESCPRAR